MEAAQLFGSCCCWNFLKIVRVVVAPKERILRHQVHLGKPGSLVMLFTSIICQRRCWFYPRLLSSLLLVTA